MSFYVCITHSCFRMHKDEAVINQTRPTEPGVFAMYVYAWTGRREAVSGSLGLAGPLHEQNLEAVESQGVAAEWLGWRTSGSPRLLHRWTC